MNEQKSKEIDSKVNFPKTTSKSKKVIQEKEIVDNRESNSLLQLFKVIQTLSAEKTAEMMKAAGWTTSENVYLYDIGKFNGSQVLNVPFHITISRSTIDDKDWVNKIKDIAKSGIFWHITGDIDDFGSKSNPRLRYKGDKYLSSESKKSEDQLTEMGFDSLKIEKVAFDVWAKL